MRTVKTPLDNDLTPMNKIIITALTISLIACSGAAEKPVSDSITSPAVQLDAGIQNYDENNYARAITHFEKSLTQYRSIDDSTGIAKSCMNLAMAYMAINNNQTAEEYLIRASRIIEQESLDALKQHLQLLNSSLAINNERYDRARDEIDDVLESNNVTIRLAALKNRTRVAFLTAADDRTQWLEKYDKLQKKHPDSTASHHARVLRFKAESSTEDREKIAYLKQSLSISRDLADRTAIAATLTQWADTDIEEKRFDEAEDKFLRALFIRHQLGDVKNTLKLLQKLKITYEVSGNKKLPLTEFWIQKLNQHDLSDWHQLFAAFDDYPKP